MTTKMKRHIWTSVILRDNETGKLLCIDGRIRDWCPIENFKYYKQESAAMKRAKFQFTLEYLYDDDLITAGGRVIRGGFYKGFKFDRVNGISQVQST